MESVQRSCAGKAIPGKRPARFTEPKNRKGGKDLIPGLFCIGVDFSSSGRGWLKTKQIIGKFNKTSANLSLELLYAFWKITSHSLHFKYRSFDNILIAGTKKNKFEKSKMSNIVYKSHRLYNMWALKIFNKMACSKAEPKMTVSINPRVVLVKEIKMEVKFQDFLQSLTWLDSNLRWQIHELCDKVLFIKMPKSV